MIDVTDGHQDWGTFDLLVFDESGLVTDGRITGSGGEGVMDPAATAHPERNEIDVSWMGGACKYQPTLTVSGTTSDMHLVLHSAPIEWWPPFQGCAAVGLFFGVTLTLDQPVEQTAIKIQDLDR